MFIIRDTSIGPGFNESKANVAIMNSVQSSFTSESVLLPPFIASRLQVASPQMMVTHCFQIFLIPMRG